MNIYTYFQAVPEIPANSELLWLWQQSWKSRGWNPVVLSLSDTIKHPQYLTFLQRVREYPTRNYRGYEDACYLRWLALEVAGGGWMSDYDVMNFGLRPPVDTCGLDFFIPDESYVPCVSYTTLAGINRAVRMLQEYGPEPKWPAKEGHISDMLIFQNRLLYGKDLGSTEPPKGVLVKEFGVTNWKKFPLVHFPTDAIRKHGYFSKTEAILKCGRPLL